MLPEQKLIYTTFGIELLPPGDNTGNECPILADADGVNY
jgi:hypothetical protein